MNTLYLKTFKGCSLEQLKNHIGNNYKVDWELLDGYDIVIADESVDYWGCDSSVFFLLKNKKIKALIKIHDRQCNLELDITGHVGTAYWLLSAAETLCKQLERDSVPIIADMKSGDYEHLLAVFDANFGDIVKL